MVTYQEVLYYWLVGGWPVQGQIPADWPGASPCQLKARMLRALRMPHEEPDGAIYRRAVCSLERGKVPYGHVAEYTTSVTAACAHALQPFEDGVSSNFLTAVTSALFQQFRRDGTIKGWYVCQNILADAAGIPKTPR